MKRNNWVWVIAAVLVLIVAVMYRYVMPSQKEGILNLKYDGKVISLRMKDIASLPASEFDYQMKINNKLTTIHCRGALLDRVIASKISGANYSKVLAKAEDGFTVAYSLNEVKARDNIYIVYRIDGKEIPPKKDGGMGPLITVVRQDPYPKRAVKYLTELELLR